MPMIVCIAMPMTVVVTMVMLMVMTLVKAIRGYAVIFVYRIPWLGQPMPPCVQHCGKFDGTAKLQAARRRLKSDQIADNDATR